MQIRKIRHLISCMSCLRGQTNRKSKQRVKKNKNGRDEVAGKQSPIRLLNCLIKKQEYLLSNQLKKLLSLEVWILRCVNTKEAGGLNLQCD